MKAERGGDESGSDGDLLRSGGALLTTLCLAILVCIWVFELPKSGALLAVALTAMLLCPPVFALLPLPMRWKIALVIVLGAAGGFLAWCHWGPSAKVRYYLGAFGFVAVEAAAYGPILTRSRGNPKAAGDTTPGCPGDSRRGQPSSR